MKVASVVAEALADGAPVVALESTIIAHGFPPDRNLEVAHTLEAAVAEQGAVPATVGVVDGELIVGLDTSELMRIASQPMLKLNVANMAVALAHGTSGATTVSATLRASRMAGIGMLATGGIGGVHRGAQADVSADLTEMAAGPIGIVSAGAKAFLDLAATLDYLETVGVTVVGYRTDEFPAFYSRASGVPLEATVHSPAEAAAVLAANRDVGGSGVLIANPISEAAALSPTDVAAWTTEAIAQADAEGVSGPSRSPYVLSRLAEISGGATVDANAALAESNAALAAEIALALADG